MANILILGHSFVHRLSTWQKAYFPNLGFPPSANISFIGFGGATLLPGQKSIQRCLPDPASNSYDAIFIHLGGNDIAAGSEPLALANAIISLCNYLLITYNASHIIIGQSFHRLSSTTPQPFNTNIVQFNTAIKTLLTKTPNPNIIFWHHRGFWRNINSLLLPDGVHLNKQGLKKYAYSLRNSLLNLNLPL